MAKLQYFAAIPDGSNWGTPYASSFKMDVHSGTFAELIPVAAGSNVTITFGGAGFVYNAAGGFGKNTLTGGKGVDTFVCSATDGDTIMDFDAHGGVGKQDLIDINGLDFTLAKSGKNTLVSFVGGDILLVGIKPAEIDATDFTAM